MATRILATLVLILAAATLGAACGGDDEDAAANGAAETGTEPGGETTETTGTEVAAPFGFELEPVAGSDISGQVTVTPSGEEETHVEIVLDSEGAAGVHPAHVHEGSSCDDLNPEPAIPLSDVEGGTSDTTLDRGVDELLDADYVVNVHASADELDTYIACGEIPTRDEVLQGS